MADDADIKADLLDPRRLVPDALNVCTCTLCESPADQYNALFVCRAHPGHIGTQYGHGFIDCTFPDDAPCTT